MNLVGNAIKFTEQGEIDVAVKRLSRRDDHVVLEFRVRDTGQGIDAQDQKRIFEPFTQSDATMTRRHGGVGLGLAICRELLEKMHGSIAVESAAGKGATFTCQVPFKVLPEGMARPSGESRPAAAKPKRAKPKPKNCPPGAGLSVLVAEDTRANQQVIRAILKHGGHQVTLVENGKQAVDKLEQSEFDVIVMDIQMPVMDGLEATQSIRAMPDADKAGVPIVAITAHAMKQDRDKCLAAGMNAYLPKPIDAHALLEVIEESCRNGREAASKTPSAEGKPPPEASSEKKRRQEKTSAEPILNLDAARKRLGQNDSLLKDLIDYFLQDYSDLLEECGKGIEAADADRVTRAAHTLKGLASNFDAAQAVAFAQEMETLGRAGISKKPPVETPISPAASRNSRKP